EPTPMLQLMTFLLVAYVLSMLAAKVNFPVSYFLIPVLAGIIIDLSGILDLVIADGMLHVAQLAIGSYIGLLLKPKMIKLKWSIVATGLVSCLLLLGFTYCCAIVI